jgi:hypothetical protein
MFNCTYQCSFIQEKRKNVRRTLFPIHRVEADPTTESSISAGDTSSDSLLRDLDLGILKNGETVEKIINLKSSAIGTKVLDFSLQTTLVDAESTTPMRSEEFEATSVIPIMAPFGSSSRITYSAPILRDDGLVVEATISTIISGNQLRGINVDSVGLIDAVSS